MSDHRLSSALERLPAWIDGYRRHHRLVLLLDFDGTLAPIVERPELAALPGPTRAALERLLAHPGVDVAIVSGRALADVRELARLPGIAYAGNHGMEIDGAGLRRVHLEAAAARPHLETLVATLGPELAAVRGALLEDKGLTLTVHHRLVERSQVPRVRHLVLAAAAPLPGLRVTEGKEVLEVRPAVEWDKGRAVEFLLDSLDPPPGAPVIYLGDDTTDEDAFRAVRGWREGGESVLVAESQPSDTAAASLARDPAEVGVLLARIAEALGA